MVCIVHSTHNYLCGVEIRNNNIVNKSTGDIIIKLLKLPTYKKSYDLSTEIKENKLIILIEIFIDFFQKTNKTIDSNTLDLLKNSLFTNNFSTPKSYLKNKNYSYSLYTENIGKFDNIYVNLDNGMIIDENKLPIVNITISSFIIIGYKNIDSINSLIKKSRKVLIICSRNFYKHVNAIFNHTTFFDKLYSKELKTIKWDFIINFNDTSINIEEFKYKTQILISDKFYSNLFETLLGNKYNICYKNIENKNKLINCVYSLFNNKNSKSLKIKEMHLSKYEKEMMVGIKQSKIELFYSYPGNYIYNKFIEKKNLKREIDSCAICFDKPDTYNITLTKCNHMFCRKCIIENMHRSNKCPLCRQKIEKNSLTFVSKFKYQNNKVDYIHSRLKKLNNVYIFSNFNESINNFKQIFSKKDNVYIESLSNINSISFEKNSEIIILDKNHNYFDLILDTFQQKNPNIDVTLLQYNIKQNK
jgi:hypothetical protein